MIPVRETRLWPASDRRFMRRALDLARRAIGLASPNPTVGCVVVQQGRIVGEGWHEYAARDHAEVLALREAGARARGATVFLTLEPCSHQGRTLPCAPLLVERGVRRVVCARTDPNPRVAGNGIARLRSSGIDVGLGLLAEEAGRLIEPFAAHVVSGLPLVVAKAAMSLDGRIATAKGTDRRISGPDANQYGQSLRLHLDAILVGIGTILADDPELSYRGRQPKARPLHRVILDSRLRTPPGARVLETAPQVPTLIFCRPGAPRCRRLRLEERGAEIIPVPGCAGGLRLKSVLQELGRRDLLGVLAEGGSEVHWSLVRERLVDKFCFLVAPIILGGRSSVPAVGGGGYSVIARAPRFKIARTVLLGEDLLVEAYPGYSKSILSPWPRREETPFSARGRAPASELR